MATIFEAAVTLAMRRDIARAGFADRQRGGSPHFAGLIITDIKDLSRRVANGIVGPRRELVLLAVQSPGEASAFGGGGEAEGGVGDDVDPGSRGMCCALQDRHVFPAFRAKTTDSVEEFQRGPRRTRVRHGIRADGPGRWRGEWPKIARPVDLLGKRAAAASQHGPRHCQQQAAHLGRDQIGAQHENTATSGRGHGTVHPRQCVQRRLEVLQIGRRTLVQDHQIDGELLQPPIFMSPL